MGAAAQVGCTTLAACTALPLAACDRGMDTSGFQPVHVTDAAETSAVVKVEIRWPGTPEMNYLFKVTYPLTGEGLPWGYYVGMGFGGYNTARSFAHIDLVITDWDLAQNEMFSYFDSMDLPKSALFVIYGGAEAVQGRDYYDSMNRYGFQAATTRDQSDP